MALLTALGASDVAEQVYLHLVENGPCDSVELAGVLELGEGEVSDATRDLRDLGLLARRGVDHLPLPPSAALQALAAERDRQAEAARTASARLGATWAARHLEFSPVVEVLTETAMVQEMAALTIRTTTTEVVALSVGPIDGPPGRPDGAHPSSSSSSSSSQSSTRSSSRSPSEPVPPEVQPGILSALAGGVGVRVVYGSRILQRPEAMAIVLDCIDRGERARVFPDVPLNLVVGESLALLSTGGRGGERLAGLLVHRGDLHTRLRGLFESFWAMAVPLVPAPSDAGPPGPGDESRELLACLAAGLTDESIAARLGVSPRTIGRRVAELQQQLGARSRFQLGVQALRRGWL
ncbi:helix-turn-helix transcriptional regulator [Terracoccus luteus]|uniref:DNA-binding CsgD family transcriptional regulator n=1 Tax=Terracoccus luteus TaxID=53356 RepID=A0A839Q1N0_9MICO|nr:helix-turn-helix transcriptional regulator [Terracoccus luteus]MBB2986982.1 DNA-binding CsgD family transcriptional regulator [Terracoccus luteus]MCP2172633.1 DNA-binding CsgD family transcriptional regulator [Terracoccus luteus]